MEFFKCAYSIGFVMFCCFFCCSFCSSSYILSFFSSLPGTTLPGGLSTAWRPMGDHDLRGMERFVFWFCSLDAGSLCSLWSFCWWCLFGSECVLWVWLWYLCPLLLDFSTASFWRLALLSYWYLTLLDCSYDSLYSETSLAVLILLEAKRANEDETVFFQRKQHWLLFERSKRSRNHPQIKRESIQTRRSNKDAPNSHSA